MKKIAFVLLSLLSSLLCVVPTAFAESFASPSTSTGGGAGIGFGLDTLLIVGGSILIAAAFVLGMSLLVILLASMVRAARNMKAADQVPPTDPSDKTDNS